MKAFIAGLCMAVCLVGGASAATVTLTFEDAVGTYTPTPGIRQNVKEQFASLGIIFEDLSDPSLGATLGKCGPGNGAVSLFGHGADFSGCGDTTPDLAINFVDPLNVLAVGFTTAVSVLNTDGLIEMSAYDALGTLLGAVSNVSGILSLSGVGAISRVTLISLDQNPTTLDDLSFETVQALAPSAVPLPASGLMLAFGGAALVVARRRKKAA